MNTFITDSIKSESLKDLKKLIDIPSVNTQPDDVIAIPPFGKEVDRSLRKTLAICEKMGMDTFYDPEGYFGYAEYGEGEETVGVLCHLDVVPEGDETAWKTPPFKATEQDGMLYGRGTQDSKGPTIAALYAFKAVLDKHENFNRKIRFIFGIDEETLWRSMKVYKKHEELPDLGFVPDSKFPVSFAEKSLLQAKLIGPGAAKVHIKSGGAPNVVPDRAEYIGSETEMLAEMLERENVDYTVDNDKLIIHGKSAHASTAHEGKNAINILTQALVGFQPHPVISFLAEKVGLETNGYSIFEEIEDRFSGELTFNVSNLIIEDDYSEIFLDMRIPVEYEKEEIIEKLKEAGAPYGLDYKEYDSIPAIYVPKDSELVQTLMQAYRDKTGDMTEPHTVGGATYARVMPNMVAFGPHFPNTPDLAHQANEYLVIDEFYQAMDIYAEVIYQLCVDVD